MLLARTTRLPPPPTRPRVQLFVASPPLEPPDDRSLLLRAQRGDRVARDEVADRLRCVPRILHVLNRRRAPAVSPQDVEDLSQDVVLLVLRSGERMRPGTALEAWAYRACVYALNNRVREKGRRRHVGLEAATASPDPTNDDDRLDGRAVVALLAELDPDQARLLRWKHLDDLSFREMGQRLDQPISTVKTRYAKALCTLRRLWSRRPGPRTRRDA